MCMEILERIFLSFLQSTITASVVIVVVISILKIYNNHISIRVKNALWILVLIKLLMPVVSENNTNVFHILYEKYGSITQSQSETNNVIEISKSPQISKKNFNSDNYNSNAEINTIDKIQENNDKNLIPNIFKIVSCIWAIGVAILILTLLLSTYKLKRKTKYLENDSYDAIVSLIENCKLKANIKSRIPVYIYDGFTSPCILGVIKPIIYIPKYVLSIKDNNQLSHIFLHELMHYKRKDLIYNFLGTIALVIHWFNPFVWIAIKEMKLYREYACDACVLELFNEEENTEYGMTILNISRMLLNKNNYSQLPIYFETKSQIKSRIGMIKEFKKGYYKMSAKAVLGCAIATVVIITNNLTVKALDVNNIIPDVYKDTAIAEDEHKSYINDVKNNNTDVYTP